MKSKLLPVWTACSALLLIVVVLLASSCGATGAGQLNAKATWPLVQRLTERQSAYVEAGILPDGRPMSVATQQVQRASLVVLRNVWHAALEEPLEPLPAPPEVVEE